MSLEKFYKKLSKLIEESGKFIIYDPNIDKDFTELKKSQIKEQTRIMVVAGEDHTETFCLTILKV